MRIRKNYKKWREPMGLSTRVLIVEDDDTISLGRSKGDME